MPKRRRSAKATGGGTASLAALRRQAQSVMKRLQRAGRRQLAVIEKEITKLNRRRQALATEINSALGGAFAGMSARARAVTGGPRQRGRRGRRARIDWDSVFTRLPKGRFSAGDVRKIVAGVAPGTLSQRLTGWVKEKKLRRTGSRRGTRYTKAA